jgi:hypothetical protein
MNFPPVPTSDINERPPFFIDQEDARLDEETLRKVHLAPYVADTQTERLIDGIDDAFRRLGAAGPVRKTAKRPFTSCCNAGNWARRGIGSRGGIGIVIPELYRVSPRAFNGYGHAENALW